MSAPLKELNANAVDTLTTYLANELSHKQRHAEATYAAQIERVPILDSEKDTEEKDNNHTRTAPL